MVKAARYFIVLFLAFLTAVSSLHSLGSLYPKNIPVAEADTQQSMLPVSFFDLPSGGQPEQIVAGSDGNLWFTVDRTGARGTSGGQVLHPVIGSVGFVTPDGDVSEFYLEDMIYRYVSEHVDSRSFTITPGPDNNIWFTQAEANKIGKINAQGELTEFILYETGMYPRSITAGPDGNIWFMLSGDEGSVVVGMTIEGIVVNAFQVPQASFGHALTFGPDGNLWFRPGYENKVARLTLTGEYTEFATNGYPVDIIAGNNNDLWLGMNGGLLTRITTNGNITQYENAPGEVAWSLAKDTNGYIWFKETLPKTIHKIGPNGENRTSYQIAYEGSYVVASDIVFGPDGNIWFANDGKVGRLTVASLPDQATGFKAEFFNNRNLAGTPVKVRQDEKINFAWGGGSPDAAVPEDQFSARWTGTSTFEAGTYEFVITADDGFRLFIDNELILDKWIDQAPTTYKVQKALSAGNHTVKFEYYEAWGGATAKLNYAKVTDPDPVSTEPTDYTAKFWNIADDGSVPEIPATAPDLQRTDRAIDYDWKDQKPAPEINAGFFVAQWAKTALFEDGTYKFTTVSDDGIRVYVDDQLVIDQWNDHSATTHVAEKVMTSGLHKVRVEYYEKWGDAVAKVNFAKVVTEPNPVPSADYTTKFWNIPDNTSVPEIPATAPVVTRTDNTIDFDWKDQSPASGVNPGFFVARWVRTTAFEDGTYTFKTTSDDGIRVFIDNELILNQWNDHSATTHTVEKAMTAGNHTIRVEYYEKWGDAVAKFSYTKNSTTPPPTTVQPAITHIVYDDELKNGWVNWSWDSAVDFAASLNPFKDTKHIKWNPNNKWAGLYFHTDAGFNTAGHKEITFAVRATKANQKMELILLDDTNTVIGTPKKLADYGGDPVVGEYRIYVIPLADLGGSNRIIKGFHLKDINGEAENEIYVDSVGFTAQ